jgi:hypothetical protein
MTASAVSSEQGIRRSLRVVVGVGGIIVEAAGLGGWDRDGRDDDGEQDGECEGDGMLVIVLGEELRWYFWGT